ncbi:MAG: outer membrane protein assembly factor BamD [Deltaproteobacteria bacterium]|nr:outer membrane protein assembly factor BamD [Deltaproteobacteria bacterium]
MMRRILFFLSFSLLGPSLFAWGLVSCASGPNQRARVSYRVSAKENFIKGKKALADEDYLEAIEYFKFVKNKFPYSTFATESDLLLADCHFARDRFIEAADAYQTFIKLHPRHAKVPYANFRIALSFGKRIPEDWFFMPPAYEFDQKEVVRTIRELEHFLARFPGDEHAPEATALLQRCKRRLAEFCHYTMEFNHKGGHMRGVVWRADELMRYGGSGYEEKALYRKAEALAELGELKASRDALQELNRRFPKGAYQNQASLLQTRLGSVKSQVPTEKKQASPKPKGETETGGREGKSP